VRIAEAPHTQNCLNKIKEQSKYFLQSFLDGTNEIVARVGLKRGFKIIRVGK
jgi:hypothetical protein